LKLLTSTNTWFGDGGLVVGVVVIRDREGDIEKGMNLDSLLPKNVPSIWWWSKGCSGGQRKLWF